MRDISICMIVRDEEDNIMSSVKSALAITNEVIVLDTGSLDRTPEIARAVGAQIYQAEWNDDFSEMRNKCIQYATKPYIFMMDADEVIVEFNSESFDEYVLNNALGQIAARIKIVNRTENGDVSDYMTRVFPNLGNYRYKGRIHEQLTYDQKPVSAVDLKVVLMHKGYMQTTLSRKDKINRNIQLLLREKEINSSPYLNYQIGRTYYLSKQYEVGISYLKQVILLNDSDDSHSRYKSGSYLALGYSYLKLRKWDLFINIFKEGIEKYPDYTDLYFMYGTALIESQNLSWFQEIPNAFQHCLNLGEVDPSQYETNAGVGSFKAHFNLGLYFELIGAVKDAILHYEESARQGYSPAIDRCKKLYT